MTRPLPIFSHEKYPHFPQRIIINPTFYIFVILSLADTLVVPAEASVSSSALAEVDRCYYTSEVDELLYKSSF